MIALPQLVRCPRCLGDLASAGRRGWTCSGGHAWSAESGFPALYTESEIGGLDRPMRRAYDLIAPLHDALVDHLLPVMQGQAIAPARRALVDRLDLDADDLRGLDRPIRILEVGFGSGGNMPELHRTLRGRPAEIHGVDLSTKMLGRWRTAHPAAAPGDPQLLLADAHALPYEADTFDRVFHVGATNSFRDPSLALAEMARVTRPGTPIVVVDEQLDPTARFHPWYRAMFEALTFYDRDPRAPVHLLPAGADVVANEQVSRFFYCLTWRLHGQVRPAPR